MNKSEFWKIVDDSKTSLPLTESEGNFDNQFRNLTQILVELGTDNISSFRVIQDEYMNEANTRALFCAQLLYNNWYLSEDLFVQFRAWLIFMGRDIYERVTNNPDEFFDVIHLPNIEEWEPAWEDIYYIPERAYEILHKLPELTFDLDSNPGDCDKEEWYSWVCDLEDEMIRKMYPKLYVPFNTFG
jgi:hypothetical protein